MISFGQRAPVRLPDRRYECAFRVQKRSRTRCSVPPGRPRGRVIAVVRPFTARVSRIGMSRKAHEMRLPCPFAHRRGDRSIQTDNAERWFCSFDIPTPSGDQPGPDRQLQEDIPQVPTRTSQFARLAACQNSPAVSGPSRESPDPGPGLIAELAQPAGAF